MTADTIRPPRAVDTAAFAGCRRAMDRIRYRFGPLYLIEDPEALAARRGRRAGSRGR